MTQAPDVVVAVAAYVPVAVTMRSSAMSPSGEVMIRVVNDGPGATLCVATVLAPKINSFGTVVVAEPLVGLVLFPLDPDTTSNALTGSIPRYSSTRTSG